MKQRIKSKHGFWVTLCVLFLFPFFLYSQTLTSVQISTDNATVGSATIHTLTFTHSDIIPSDGKIVVRYPSGFNLSNVSIVSSKTIDDTLYVSAAGDAVTISRSGLGTPEFAGHTETIRYAAVTNRGQAGPFQVTVETQNADNSLREWGTSTAVTLNPGSIQTFQVSLPASVTSSGATAGTAFQANIEARDAWGNRATGFTGTATLSDPTGTLSISSNGTNQTTNPFSSGQWSGNVSILKTVPTVSNYIRAISGSSSGASVNFSVLPGALDKFVFGTISSPQTADVQFGVSITAYDAYNNIKTDYTGSATLSEKTGTITVPGTSSTSTGNFTAGLWTGNVQITQANTDIYISASDGRTGTANPINVIGAGVDHFTISNISTQSAGEYFLVTLTARDANENVATSFSGSGRSVSIAHSGAGTISPTTSGNFSNGVWTGNLRISQVQTSDQISVNDGSGHTGTSNQFNVISSSVDHFRISSIATTQTAGVGFSVTIQAEDVNNNIVTSFTNQVVGIHDETNTNSPQQVTLTNGTWTGSITITQAMNSNFLTASAVSKTGTSNTFNVVSAGVSRFELSTITSPRTAGTAFNATITAYDTYGNIAQSFSGSVSLSAGSVTVTPTTVSGFTNGVRTVSLTITQAASDIQITATDGSHSGSSNYFNVTHNALHHFAISQIPDQTPGVPFTLIVTAQDVYNNKAISFNGTGNRVNISHSGSGTLSLYQSDDFQNGIWSGTLSVTQTQTADRITVTRDGGSQTGQSNAFNVIPTTVDHFTFNSVSSTVTAGQAFSITVRAYDVNNNPVTSFTNGTPSLSDETGTNNIKQLNFVNGVATASVTITKTQTQNSLTVTAFGNKSGVSNDFDVLPGAVQSFSVSNIASPQVAGVNFLTIMTALDAFGNQAQFTATVTLSDLTGTLALDSGGSTSGYFIDGRRTELVRITEARNDVVLMVSRNGVQMGQSNPFNVLPAALNRFTIDPVLDQIVGEPFSIRITAQDQYGNVKTNFNQTVDIADQTGTISPNISLSFSNGQVSTSVTVHQAVSNDVIRVTQTGGIVTSNSNPFDVVVAPGIQVSDFRALNKDRETPIQSVTTDQDTIWYLRCTVRNLSGAQARLDSIRIQFTVAGLPRQDYTVQLPTTFWGTGTPFLAGSQTDSLLIPVTKAGHNPGAASVRGFVYLKNMESGSTLKDDEITSLEIQTPAELIIRDVRSSQNEVSSNQVQAWRIAVVVSNTGKSAVQMDSSQTLTHLTFSLGSPATWEVQYPPPWADDWVLEGGETDSLIYAVRRTTNQSIGQCRIDASLSGIEINTGRRINRNTSEDGYGEVLIETPANLIIRQVSNLAPNSPYVSRNQKFNLFVQIENTGGDAARDVEVQIGTTGSSIFAGSHTIGRLTGGQRFDLTVPVTAASQTNPLETFTASASGYAENTNLYIEDTNSPDNTASATIQSAASLRVLSVTPSQTELLGGQMDAWKISIALQNSGGAAIELSKPSADSLLFSVGNIYQTDYKITPPTALQGTGTLILSPGVTDTLIYTVNHTGTYGGLVTVRAKTGGKDRNSQTSIKATAETQVTVIAEMKFRILSTQIDAINVTDAKNGFVNTGQTFRTLVIIENGLSYTIRNIDVRLQTNGQSTILTPQQQIALLEPSRRDSIWFDVQAAAEKNLSGETFTATITGAKRENGVDDAAIGDAIDATAQVIVQTPASLSFTLKTDPESGVVSVNQQFDVIVFMEKTGESALKDDARVQISWPGKYQLISTPDTASILPGQTVSWTLQAPPDSSSNDEIRVTLSRSPYDKNTNQKVTVPINWARIAVSTIPSRLSSLTTISTPAGAADGILSTGQSFVVKTEVFADNVKDITVSLELPVGYSTKNNLKQSASGDTATWLVTAPEYPALGDMIYVSTKGYDGLQQDVQISGAQNTLSVTTVTRAALSLSFVIDSPTEAALYGTVSPGQEFKVRAAVRNNGVAETEGDIEVTLTLPSNYTSRDVLTKVLENGEAFWTLKAPTQPSSAAALLEATITKIPQDVNTNLSAHVLKGNVSVPINLQSSWLAVSSAVLPEGHGTVTPGQVNVPLMALALDNRGESGTYPIHIDQISLVITGKDGEEISPRSVFSALEIFSYTGETLYGSQTQIPAANPVSVLLDGLEIPYAQSLKILIRGRIAETEIVPYFLVNLSDSTAILAKEAGSDRDVPVRNPEGEKLENIPSPLLRIFNPDAEHQLWNSPNPFGEPGKEETTIYYYVPTQTRVTFKIFTIVGQPVKTVEIAESEVTAGHVGRWVWDGRNDKGMQVLNGVYHLIMLTGDGKTVKFKMAYVK